MTFDSSIPMQKLYITTAIAYPNAKPHIGFAMELIQADCLARYYRMKLGEENVYFLTGTDEHGMKIYQTALENKKTAQEWVDFYAKFFQDLTFSLNISNNDFIRTTEDRHKRGASKLWKALVKSGDIYKDKYSGLYCVGCESYILEKDLADGKCPDHLKEPQKFEEENYFFKYTKYIPKVINLIEKDELKIAPGARKNEILNLLKDAEKEGRDVSFSRPSAVLPWGIPVPDDPSQTMYVWPDALANYITALGYENDLPKYKTFWPADVHLIGKDILRFHAGFWPAMLLSAKIPLPKAIYVHGYITSEGQKMSKSLGNVVDPFEIIEKFGADSVRWFLLREIPTADDGDFSKERFAVVYNSELANNLGNLASRVTAMFHKYFGGKVSEEKIDEKTAKKTREIWDLYEKNFESFNLKAAAETVLEFLNFLNAYVDDTKPWQMAKEKRQKELLTVLTSLLEALRHVGLMTQPFIPQASEKIAKFLNIDLKESMQNRDFSGFFKSGHRLNEPEVLFPKI